MGTLADLASIGSSFTEAEERLAVVMRRGYPHTPDYAVRVFAANGWAAEHYEAVEALARWAAEEGLLAWNPAETPAGLLSLLWESLVRHHDVPAAAATRWVAVLVGARDAEAWRLGSLATAESAAAEVADPLGPLAFATGMTAAEMRAGLAAGRLTADGLALLAGLRGWRLPPAALTLP